MTLCIALYRCEPSSASVFCQHFHDVLKHCYVLLVVNILQDSMLATGTPLFFMFVNLLLLFINYGLDNLHIQQLYNRMLFPECIPNT